MAEPTLRVVAHILARTDTITTIKALLESLVVPTRQEEGCIRYELLQNTADPADFTFDEEWTSDAALEQHLASPHLQAALPTLNELVAAPVDIRRYWLVA
jgi:quinol monooxygenase YgiN